MAAERLDGKLGKAAERRALDGVRSSVDALVGGGHGAIAVSDALMGVAAELMIAKVGRAGAALWLRDVFDEMRFGRV